MLPLYHPVRQSVSVSVDGLREVAADLVSTCPQVQGLATGAENKEHNDNESQIHSVCLFADLAGYGLRGVNADAASESDRRGNGDSRGYSTVCTETAYPYTCADGHAGHRG
jgi:hypothetical protein